MNMGYWYNIPCLTMKGKIAARIKYEQQQAQK